MSQIFNSQQKEAIEHVSGPLIIVAGAGTGKTTVISQKIVYLIKNNYAKPEEILALAFNDKAADEIIQRVDDLMDIGYVEMHISTFHAFCKRLLENHGLEIGLSNQFENISETDAWILMKQNLNKFNLKHYKPLGNPTRHIHELLNHFKKCKDELISTAEYLEYATNLRLDNDNNTEEQTRLSEIASAYHAYNQLLLENNYLDFGDLIFFALDLLNKRKNILALLQKQFKYILVDEFQDVNWAQYQLVRNIAGLNGNLVVVGDDDQSIYAFRGASVANILRFQKDYPNCKKICLTENYRSGQSILDLAYMVIQNNNPDRLEFKLGLNKKIISATNIKSEVALYQCDSLDHEVEKTITEIINIKNSDSSILWSDFAIIVRANNHALPFVNALESARIPFEHLSSTGLYRQPIVLDCLSYFKLLDNYHESTALYRLLHFPIFNISGDDFQKIFEMSRKKSLSFYETISCNQDLKLSTVGQKIINKILSHIHAGMAMARKEKPQKVLFDFLKCSEYLKYLAEQESVGNQEIIKQINQLRAFFEIIKKYEERNPDATVLGFVEYLHFLTESGDEGSMYQQDDSPDSVRVLTIHRAKGMEYKFVFLVNMVEERFPLRRHGGGIEIPADLVREQLPEGDSHYQEERRLFYVAATRAKEKLFLFTADDYGGARNKKISRFISEAQLHRDKIFSIKNIILDPKIKTIHNEQQKCSYVLPKEFSYSQIEEYARCPYLYKLKNITKIPTAQSHYLSFGNSVHKTMQKFYEQIITINQTHQESIFGLSNPSTSEIKQKIKSPSLKEFLTIYETNWIDDWYIDKKQKEDYFNLGKDILVKYYNDNNDKWSLPIAVEIDFKFKISGVTLKGRIDRIDNHAELLNIIDYKTGEIPDKPKAEHLEQVILYQLALENIPYWQKFNKAICLNLFYLQGPTYFTIKITDNDKQKLIKKIVKCVDKIKQEQFNADPNKFKCQQCSYRDICQWREI